MAFDLRLVNKMFVLAKNKDGKWSVHNLLGQGIWTLDIPPKRIGNLDQRKKFKYLVDCKIVTNKQKLEVGDVVYSNDDKGHRSVYYVLSVIEQDDGTFETVIGR